MTFHVRALLNTKREKMKQITEEDLINEKEKRQVLKKRRREQKDEIFTDIGMKLRKRRKLNHQDSQQDGIDELED